MLSCAGRAPVLAKVKFCYKAISSEESIFWQAQNERMSYKTAAASMTLTAIQRIYSVLQHKQRYEASHGEISASASQGMVKRSQASQSDLRKVGGAKF